MPIGRVWIYRLLFVCLFVWLRISPPVIKLVSSNFVGRFIGVPGRAFPIFMNFAPQTPKIGRIGHQALVVKKKTSNADFTTTGRPTNVQVGKRCEWLNVTRSGMYRSVSASYTQLGYHRTEDSGIVQRSSHRASDLQDAARGECPCKWAKRRVGRIATRVRMHI